MNFSYLVGFLCFVLAFSPRSMAQPNLVALAAQKIESLLGQKEQEVKQHRENLDVLEKTKQTLKQQSYNAKQKNDRKSAQALASELSRIEKELKQATKLWNEASSFLTELSEINRASTNYQLKWIKKYEQTHGPINPVTSTILATTTSDPIITTPQLYSPLPYSETRMRKRTLLLPIRLILFSKKKIECLKKATDESFFGLYG